MESQAIFPTASFSGDSLSPKPFVSVSRYHTGSLAFGSLILSLVQVIRVVLEYLDHKLKGQDNKVHEDFFLEPYILNIYIYLGLFSDVSGILLLFILGFDLRQKVTHSPAVCGGLFM